LNEPKKKGYFVRKMVGYKFKTVEDKAFLGVYNIANKGVMNYSSGHVD